MGERPRDLFMATLTDDDRYAYQHQKKLIKPETKDDDP